MNPELITEHSIHNFSDIGIRGVATKRLCMHFLELTIMLDKPWMIVK